MDELKSIYDTIKDYRQGCVLIFIDTVETLGNGFYIVDRYVDRSQKRRYGIGLVQISNNIYCSSTYTYKVRELLEKNYSQTKYILLDIYDINTSERETEEDVHDY